MLTKITHKLVLFTVVFATLCLSAVAQTNIRPYTQVYSENLKGGTVMFGNTSMNIIDNGAVNLTKMNGLTIPATGLTPYGNDNQNMQFADVDATPANLTSFSLGASGWKYLANGSNQGTAWRTTAFNDSAWQSGAAELGYGDNPVTVLTASKITYYFRNTVNIANPS